MIYYSIVNASFPFGWNTPSSRVFQTKDGIRRETKIHSRSSVKKMEPQRSWSKKKKKSSDWMSRTTKRCDGIKCLWLKIEFDSAFDTLHRFLFFFSHLLKEKIRRKKQHKILSSLHISMKFFGSPSVFFPSFFL